jgi:hypothetical protein
MYRLVIDRTTLYWGLLAILVFEFYLAPTKSMESWPSVVENKRKNTRPCFWAKTNEK